MLKPIYKGHTIEINLPRGRYNGYSVECTYRYNKKIEKYMFSMWLKKKGFDEKFKIESEKIDTQPIAGTKETIVDNICRMVDYASSTGYFDHFVERFDYTCKCFDKGDEFFETERLAQENGNQE